MSDQGIIGDLTLTIQDFLQKRLNPDPTDPDCSVIISTPYAPTEPTPPALVIFLYQITENPFYKNNPPPPVRDVNGAVVGERKPALYLNLNYLLIPYAKPDSVADGHRHLGAAMKAIHQDPVIPQAHWQGEVVNLPSAPQMVLQNLSLDDLNKIWASYSDGLRLCVGYEVEIVVMQPETVESRVPVRQVDVGIVPDLDEANRIRAELEGRGS